MEWLNQIPEQFRDTATVVFIVVLAAGTAFNYLRGKKKGSTAPKVQEFYADGAFADMGPVKELVGQTGLLFQQQVRTNIALEACAVKLSVLVAAYTDHLDEEAMEAEIDRRVRREPRRRPVKRTPAEGD